MELLSEPCTLGLLLLAYALRAGFLDVDDLLHGIELVDVEVEEFVDDLSHRFGVLLFRHVELLYYLQIFLEESISFIHTVDFFVDVFS